MPVKLCYIFLCLNMLFWGKTLAANIIETPLLGLGPRYFFNHYPGH